MERSYKGLGEMICELAEVLRPPERLSVSDAAEKYRYVNNPGSYVGPWRNDTTPYMVEPADEMTNRKFNSVIFVGPAQCGKALALDTPLPTPSGWTSMGDVRVGDELIGADGKPCRVVFATEVMLDHDCFEVEFDDGTKVIADRDHKWLVESQNGWSKVMTTGEIEPKHRFGKSNRSTFAVRNTKPIELPAAPLPIGPYTLGSWLGDGHSRTCRIYGALDDVLETANHIRAEGHFVEVEMDEKRLGVLLVDQHNAFCDRLRDLGLHKGSGGRKHIPATYLRASQGQRLQLLRGLMDTDGTCGKNGACSFTTTSPELADGICELLASLGFKYRTIDKAPKTRHKGVLVDGKPAKTITFFAYSDTPVFNLARKRARQRDRAKSRPTYTERRMIVSVKPVASVPVRCIQVDNADHLFLCTRSMVPTHNTDALIVNPIVYSVVCDPMDMLVYQTSQTMARDFSRRRIDRLHRHSAEVGKRMMPGGDSDNTFDKFYLSGMILTLSWPTINELSGRPVGRVILTDYDRMPMDVDGEGSPFDLARKRTTTFGTAACTIAESSPGHTVEDPRWLRRTPHEAPPCPGILALYNRGDRRRWYWKCPHCGEWFEPSFNLIKWVDSKDIMESAESAKMMCPHCTALIDPGMKHTLNRAGRWVRDGQKLTRDDVLEGTAIRSDIASFWMKGPAATFAKWSDLVSRYLLAEQEFERTGSQEALKSTVNTDQGEPYYPRGSESLRSPDELKQRASELPEQQVPAGVRFLVATADVQKNQWVAQVFGVGPGSAGEPFKACLIDRFEIRKSKRRDDDGDALWVKPGAFLEDWDLVREQIIERRYPLADGTGELGIAFIACDSGGKDGVTANAYDFFRKLRREGAGEHTRFFLVKGEGNNAGAPRVRISFPDAQKKDRSAAARGDVPVMLLNVNLLKDDLAGMIERATVDGGSLEWPAWLPDNWYEEMCAERRTDKGWENPRKARNEAWDLATYLLGVLRHKKVDRINWEAPPSFAELPEKNAHFFPANKPVAEPKKGSYNKLADLAAKLA